jgi:hypothetical protein
MARMRGGGGSQSSDRGRKKKSDVPLTNLLLGPNETRYDRDFARNVQSQHSQGSQSQYSQSGSLSQGVSQTQSQPVVTRIAAISTEKYKPSGDLFADVIEPVHTFIGFKYRCKGFKYLSLLLLPFLLITLHYRYLPKSQSPQRLLVQDSILVLTSRTTWVKKSLK